MFTRLKLIANIKRGSGTENYTYYFFSNKYRALLPIQINKQDIRMNGNSFLLKLLKCFQISIKRILVYHFDGIRYYSYLMLESSMGSYEVNFALEELIDLQKAFNCPLYIKSDLLEKKGIRITKRMVLNALKEDLYLK